MEQKKERQKELETARTHVKVYLSPEEKAVIKKKADSFGKIGFMTPFNMR